MKNFLFMALAVMSLEVLAQRFEIGRDSKTFTIKPDTTSLEATFAVPLYRIDERLVVEQVLCRVPQCTSEAGDGSSGNWHNFFKCASRTSPPSSPAR